MNSEAVSTPEPSQQSLFRSERLISLDAFRGFVIAGMLLVNTTWGEENWGTGIFRDLSMQFAHIDWNDPVQGATFTDLVFPWFLFIMGAAVPLSMRSGRGKQSPALKRILIAVRRGLVIYLLGVLITFAGTWTQRAFVWTDLLSWNILQLIGIAYIVTVMVGLLPKWGWWTFVGVVLIGKWALMLSIPADFVRATLEASNIAPRGSGPTGLGTFTHFDDVKRFVAREHISGTENPWGRYLLGWFGMAQQWLPCAAIAVMGAIAVDWLTNTARDARLRAGVLFGVGIVLTALATLLQWGYTAQGGGLLGPLTIPYSKWFFSPSYCLLTAGTGSMLLAVFFAIIDLGKQRWFAEPWRTYGVNALALYVGAELTFKLAFSRWLLPVPWNNADGTTASNTLPGAVNAWVKHFLPEGNMINSVDNTIAWAALSGIAFATLWLIGWWLICRWLDVRKIYIKV